MNITFPLNFTSGALDPQINFSRSSAATRTNSSGLIELVAIDVPRFNYDPLTLVCSGLLIEEQRTNLFTYSEQFENITWSKSNTTITSNAIDAPDGSTTADKLVASASNSQHAIFTSYTTTASPFTFSVCAKLAEQSWLFMRLSDSGGAPRLAWFNLATGALGTINTNLTATIASIGNGFYRCSITVLSAVAGAQNVLFGVSNADGSNTYTGDGSGGIYIWGAQLEAGAFATSYIPTTTTALTRNADVATITGSNFTSFWNATQGGATVQATPSTVSGIRPLVQYDDGTANEIIALRGNTTNPELYIVDNGTPQAQLDAGTIAANTAYSLTGWWATNDCRARKDSGAAVTDATATIPTVTQARIGSDGTNYLNGTIATINYYAAFSSQIYTRRKNKVVSSLF